MMQEEEGKGGIHEGAMSCSIALRTEENRGEERECVCLCVRERKKERERGFTDNDKGYPLELDKIERLC